MRDQRMRYLASCCCVPSPQSTRKILSSSVTTCDVGCRSYAGKAELFPSIVTASIQFIKKLSLCLRRSYKSFCCIPLHKFIDLGPMRSRHLLFTTYHLLLNTYILPACSL